MLNAEKRKAILELILSLPFQRAMDEEATSVDVQINSVSWYETKAIYVGRVVGPSDSGFEGTKIVGALRPWVEQHKLEVETNVKRLNQADWDYLLTPWNIEEPTTAHELTARYQMG